MKLGYKDKESGALYALLSGTVGREPEMVEGKSLLKFSVRYEKGKYLDVAVWGNQAIALNGLLHKDDAVLVCGEVSDRVYNEKTYYTLNTYGEVFPAFAMVDSLLHTINGGTQAALPVPVVADPSDEKPIDDNEDLPF